MPRKYKRKSKTSQKRQVNIRVEAYRRAVQVAGDLVNSPSHYGSKRMVNGRYIEVIDVCEAFDLDHYDSSAIQYILRSDKKGATVQDYKKAIWYMVRKMRKQLNQLITVSLDGKVTSAAHN